MIRKKHFLSGCVLFLIVFLMNRAGAAQESPWEPAIDATEKITYKTLDDLSAALEKTYNANTKSVSPNRSDMYLEALAKIKDSRPMYEKKPESDKARAAFFACSLATEAALLQMQVQINEAKIRKLNETIKNTQNEINRVHETISFRERSKASQLKADLEAEKEKARKLREEAEKKFQELQSSLIQVTNDARGTIISMSDILFEVNKANLTPDLKTSLAKIAGILLVFKTSNIIVEGHTDNQGSAEYNQKLSEKRAENVMSFLIEQGVDSGRLTSVGYGFTKPIADNETKEGRQKNRRVDLIIQEKKTFDDE
jgi:outer membrane protein OmpA-like peptidoglycan-associated protein